ncbi:MAG: hypothetical protein LBT85_02015 [Bifidobacteriaceae bacterium]|jgi:hypothetical protein|nr:hypothetical protein [Bifidobacteriaceae bacterium]
MAGSDGLYKGVVGTSALITSVNSVRINRNLVEANRLQKLQNQHLKYMAEAQNCRLDQNASLAPQKMI